MSCVISTPDHGQAVYMNGTWTAEHKPLENFLNSIALEKEKFAPPPPNPDREAGNQAVKHIRGAQIIHCDEADYEPGRIY